MAKAETWTITVQFTVFAGDMAREDVIGTAESGLTGLTDGTDYMGCSVIDATRDEI